MQPLTIVKGFFDSRGIKAYIVGGFVRDAIIGRESRDLDLAVAGDAAALAEALAEEVGGVHIVLGHDKGVSRIVATINRAKWNLDISSLDGDILQDLSSRDFTINALALELKDTKLESPWDGVVDPVRGRKDIENRVVRATSEGVFREDPLRLIRAIRLSAQLGFSIEPRTLEQMERHASLITQVAVERVREELLKILEAPKVGESLRLLDRVGLLCTIVPELALGKGVEQPKEHHWDVFEHGIETAAAVERVLNKEARARDQALSLIPWEPFLDEYFQEEVSDGHTRATLLKLAGLLHDVSKPSTKSFEPTGRMRFLGHHTEGAKVAVEVLARLRFSRKGISTVKTMVEHHLRPSQVSQKGAMPTQRAVYRYFRDVGDVAIDTLYLSHADYLAARGPGLDMEDWSSFCSVIGCLLASSRPPRDVHGKVRLVDGNDLIQLFQLTPGPIFKVLLKKVQEVQGSGEISTREEALKLVERLIKGRLPVGGTRA